MKELMRFLLVVLEETSLILFRSLMPYSFCFFMTQLTPSRKISYFSIFLTSILRNFDLLRS